MPHGGPHPEQELEPLGILDFVKSIALGQGARKASEIQATDFAIPGQPTGSELQAEIEQRESFGVPATVPRALMDEQIAIQGEQRREDLLEAREQRVAIRAIGVANMQRDLQDMRRKEDRIGQLQDDIRPETRQIGTMAAAVRASFAAEAGFAGDGTVVNALARLFNPTGVLTDDDIRRVSGDPSISSTIARAIGRYLDGDLLTGPERKEIQRATASLYQQNRNSVSRTISPLLRTAEVMGINRDEIIDANVFIDDDELAPFLGVPADPAERTTPLEPTPDRFIDGRRVIRIEELEQSIEAEERGR